MLETVWVGGIHTGQHRSFGQRRIVTKLRVVEVEIHRIQPEPVDTPFQPEPCRIQNSILNVPIVKIEVWLAA